MISMVRPGAQEQQSAKRVVCPRARAEPPLQLLVPPPCPVSVLGVFVGFILASCGGVPDYPAGSWRTCGWGHLGCACVSYRSAGASVRLREAPGCSSARRADPAAMWGAGSLWGPGRAQPPPPARGGEGRGRRSPETWRERGGNGPQLLAGGRGSRERRSLPLGAGLDPAGVWLRFFCPFPAFERPRERASLGEGRERLRPPGPRRTSSLSRAGGYAENARSGRGPQELPGRGARRGLRAGAGRRARAGAPDGRRRRRKDGGAPEPCHSTSAWSGASPTPWPWLR